MNIQKNKQLGELGEAIAAKYMIKKGYEFIEKNFHAQGGEIDLIFQAPGGHFYIFVEVKTRSNNKFGDAKESVNHAKIQKIMRAGYDYFTKKQGFKSAKPFRIDGIFLRLHEGKFFCEHLENIGFE